MLVYRQRYFILRVPQIDVFYADRKCPVLPVIAPELGQFLLIRGFQVLLPFAPLGSPDNLDIVLGVQNNVWLTLITSADEIPHVDPVNFEQQRLGGRERFVHPVHSVQYRGRGGEIVT